MGAVKKKNFNFWLNLGANSWVQNGLTGSHSFLSLALRS